MPNYSKQRSTNNEELGPKYALNRLSSVSRDIGNAEDTIFTTRFHVSENLEASKKWFKKQKTMLKSKSILFEDPFFPAEDSSLFYSERPKNLITWKRPKEMRANAAFITDGISRFDIKQGEIGDCWLVAAVSSLSLHQELFIQVVPEGQEFNESDYVGAFMFRFWRFGTWLDFVVDDRLPTCNNRLPFLHSTDVREFWSALLEKAYAKLASSYEALKGGSSSEAMEDFTGGVCEILELGPSAPNNLWDILVKADRLSSLMGCSVEALSTEIEGKGPLGLIMGHAYSVTDVKTVTTNEGPTNLIRIRNPWGNQYEWQGAWSDKSSEWQHISDSERLRLTQTSADDGEFWMSFVDFSRYFSKLEICHLSPESQLDTRDLSQRKKKWEMCIENGEWQKNVSAGGCRNFINTFHMNPQFRVSVTDPDEDDEENTGTLVVGLMQKEMRSRRKEGRGLTTIGYTIYCLKDNAYEHTLLDSDFFRANVSVAKSPSFANLREICGRHRLPPGKYVIIPSTFSPGEEAKFLLRIFSEKPYDSEQLDQVTEIEELEPIQPTPEQKIEEDQSNKRLRQAFLIISGEDQEVDAYELQEVLNGTLKNENFKFDGFSRETCRSMVAMMDTDQSGKLGFEEFKVLWDELRLWKAIFKMYDKDKSGNFNSFEIREALNHIGFRVSNRVFTAITTRYADKDGIITFDDYILLLVRLKTVLLAFNAQNKTETGDAIFSKEEFIQRVLYL